MNIPFNPDSWLDFAAILSVAGLAAFSSVYAARSQRMVARLDKSINNGHSADQPLRGDVDEIRDTLKDIRKDLHSVKSELGDIRHEIREERTDRLELDRRFEHYRRDSR